MNNLAKNASLDTRAEFSKRFKKRYFSLPQGCFSEMSF
jgi:hypothetical protein